MICNWCSATDEVRSCEKNVDFNKDSTLNLAILANPDMIQSLALIFSFEIHRCRISCFNKTSNKVPRVDKRCYIVIINIMIDPG